MTDFEPGIMWLHRGQLTAAQDIVRTLRTTYKGTKLGDMLNEAFYIITGSDKELALMTEEKNESMFNKFKSEMEGTVDESFERESKGK